MADTTIVSFLLDRSGSMISCCDDTIGGFNSYIDTLNGDGTADVSFSLVLFDSTSIDKLYVGVPINQVKALDRKSYVPRDSTPLIDACVKTIHATAEAAAKAGGTSKVVVVFQTDGQENASRQYKMSDLQDLIKEKTAAGWSFIYLGCGFDAYGDAMKMGVSGVNTMSYGRADTAPAFAATASNTKQYMASGRAEDLSYSTVQRAAAGEDKLTAGRVTPTTPAQPTPPTGTATVKRPANKTTGAPNIVDDFSLIR